MSADGHHTRAHALCSPSGMSRNMVCAGNIAMSSLCEDVEREAAAWGTCAHQISERCLVSGPVGGFLNADSFIGETEKSGKFEFVVDEEMANTAQVYIDYCRDRLAEYKEATGQEAVFWIEHRISLAPLNPALETNGTADFIIWFPLWKLVEVIDLKGGRGVTVDVVGNPQGRAYSIGTLVSLPQIQGVERVKVTIVQPRVGSGEPKSDEFHVADLYDWVVDLLGLIQRCKDALDEFNALGDSRILFDEWADKWLTPGQCTFCTAKPICPALRKKALAVMPDLARTWHEDITLTTPPTLPNLAKTGSPEELAHDLDGFDELEGWIKARRAFAHAEAERGNPPPGYGLVDKIGNRTWKEKDPNNLCCAIQDALNLKGNDILEPGNVKSVAQIEKVLGKRKAELAKLEGVLWEKPIRGTNLVRLDKTTRPAAKGLTERFNEAVE